MTWIFGSFLVTPCALTSCQVVIRKQGMTACHGSQVQQVCNRKETMWYPRGQILYRVQRIGSRARDTQPIRGLGRLWRYGLHGGASVVTPWFPEEGMGKKKCPLRVYVSPSISQLTTNRGPLSRIKWKIYFYKEVFRSFIDWVYKKYISKKDGFGIK